MTAVGFVAKRFWGQPMEGILGIETKPLISESLDNQFDAVEALLGSVDAPASSAPSSEASPAKIMIVDDEPINIKVVRKYLERGGYQDFVTTDDATSAMRLFEQQRPDVVLLDLMMPNVGGLEILEEIRKSAGAVPTPVLVLTATDDQETKLSALELGATDFLRKPVDPTDLVPRVKNVLAVKAHQDHLRDYARKLEVQVRQRTAELEASRLEVIYCLARAAEYRDNETGRHVIRVGRYVSEIARALGMDDETVSLLEHAAPLHDMGKIGIPDAVLLKPGRLDSDEFAKMQKHTEYGYNIVSTVDSDDWSVFIEHTSLGAEFMRRTRSPLLMLAASIAVTHHEKWDGSGYPKGLKGDEIPIEGRITAIADVFDALSSKRPYKPAFPLEKCLQIIRDGSGSHFEPRIVDAFFSQLDEIVSIRKRLADE